MSHARRSLKICGSTSSKGWVCENDPDCTGPHRGGDEVWTEENDPEMAEQNRVLSLLLDGGEYTADQIAKALGLPLRLVDHHLDRLIHVEQLVATIIDADGKTPAIYCADA